MVTASLSWITRKCNKIRLMGIDAAERGQPFADASKARDGLALKKVSE